MSDGKGRDHAVLFCCSPYHSGKAGACLDDTILVAWERYTYTCARQQVSDEFLVCSHVGQQDYFHTPACRVTGIAVCPCLLMRQV